MRFSVLQVCAFSFSFLFWCFDFSVRTRELFVIGYWACPSVRVALPTDSLTLGHRAHLSAIGGQSVLTLQYRSGRKRSRKKRFYHPLEPVHWEPLGLYPVSLSAKLSATHIHTSPQARRRRPFPFRKFLLFFFIVFFSKEGRPRRNPCRWSNDTQVRYFLFALHEPCTLCSPADSPFYTQVQPVSSCQGHFLRTRKTKKQIGKWPGLLFCTT